MLESGIFRRPKGREAMVLAAFSYRYDAHLVPGLLENLRPAVHGYVAWDDRDADVALTPETRRRALLLDEARRLGAHWILAADPDERFEDRLADRLPEMTAHGEDTLWMFPIREMYGSDSYRTDGIWGGRTRMRLFPMRAAVGELTVALHGRWIADSPGYVQRNARINIYHLRMASPVRRRLRRELYAAADPTRRFQSLGYDYLDDERGMRLETIPAGRGYSPAFVDDHGSWSPDPEALGPIVPDAIEHRLAFAAQSVLRQGHAPALHVLQDLCAASPQDEDLPHLVAIYALMAGLFAEAWRAADAVLARRPDDIQALLLRLRAGLWSGKIAEARRDAEALACLAPESALAAHYLAETGRATMDFTAPDAQWRRWVTGPAVCREGARVARSEMSVVVIGFRAQASLAAAVASVLAQDAAAEIVVVNSGGGDVQALLNSHLDRVRLIEIAEPLFVGAARNIGIDASRAAYIAFLAGDCQAEAGWVSGRLGRHRAGALSVSTPVFPEPGAGPIAEGANRLLYWGRRPDTAEAYIAHFGRSYHRRLFDEVGPFAPGLRISEDERLNRLVDRIAPPVWAPEVVTRHRDPKTLWQLVRSHYQRGINRAGHPPFRAMAGAPDRARRLAEEMRNRLQASRSALRRDTALGWWARRLLGALQRLACRADQAGVARGLARIGRAEALVADDPALAQALDPQDWRKLAARATALAGTDDAAAIALFSGALALAPGAAKPLDGLARCLARSASPAEALAQAERAALRAPLSPQHWEIAAQLALAAGQPGLALAHARRALALVPNLPAAHLRTAHCHRAAGNPVAALFRDHTAARLNAAEAGPAP